jgi:hypothetical protein
VRRLVGIAAVTVMGAAGVMVMTAMVTVMTMMMMAVLGGGGRGEADEAELPLRVLVMMMRPFQGCLAVALAVLRALVGPNHRCTDLALPERFLMRWADLRMSFDEAGVAAGLVP